MTIPMTDPGVRVEVTELTTQRAGSGEYTHIASRLFVKVGGDVEELIAMLKAAGYEERR